MNALRTTALAALVGAAPALGQDPLFDQTRLHTVQIETDPADWAALQAEYWSNQFYAADVALDGEVVRQVGLRSRGDGSRNAAKPGLKLDFNRYVPGQEFHGYKGLVLDNCFQDATCLKETLTFQVFEAMGLPAPQEAHARLYVNGQYWGLYGLVEQVSGHFLNERFGESAGNLFDYEWVAPWRFEYLGDDPGAYIPSPFDPDQQEQPFDGGGLVELVRDVNLAGSATLLDELQPHLESWRLLSYVAVENAVADRDGFVGDWGVNNLYFYQYRGQRRFVLVPWDKDNAFCDGHWRVERGLAENVLTRRLLEHPQLRDHYAGELRRAVTSFVNSRWLLPRLDALYALVRAAALADDKKPFSNADFENGVATLRSVIAAREADVLEQMP
jgi:spore coat protein CotH